MRTMVLPKKLGVGVARLVKKKKCIEKCVFMYNIYLYEFLHINKTEKTH